MPCRFAVMIALLAGLLGGAPPALAHNFTITDVLVVFKSDGTYLIDLRIDLDALALGVMPTEDSGVLAFRLRSMPEAERQLAIQSARETILHRVRVRFDGQKQQPLVTFPEQGSPLAESSAIPSVLGTTARLTGRVPDGAREFTFGASRTFGPVHLTILDEATATGVKYVLDVSEDSPPYRLGEPPAPPNRLEVAERFLRLGYEHILPKGLDHILFVLGLFLLSTKFRPLLWQITAFTIAHSVSLALSMYGIVSLPSRVVEPLIALSIAYVAIENLFTRELKPWRPAVVFGFGLLHGLGFAGALRDLGLPRSEFAMALLSFNVGVELGQLSVVLIAFALVGWFRNKRWYRPVIVIPASSLIAAIGLYWAVQRAFFSG